MGNGTELIKQLYEDFNARRVDPVLAKLTEDVMWANGMDGGYVHSHKDVRDYWERQWAVLNPHIQPVSFRETEEGSVVVDALFTGGPLEDQTPRFKDMPVGHVFHLKEGLVFRFDIPGRS
jgi:hypothetical protein